MQNSASLPNLSTHTEVHRAALVDSERRISCDENKDSNFSIVSLTSSEEEICTIDNQIFGLNISPDVNLSQYSLHAVSVDDRSNSTRRNSFLSAASSEFEGDLSLLGAHFLTNSALLSHRSESSLALSELEFERESDTEEGACGGYDEPLDQNLSIDINAYDFEPVFLDACSIDMPKVEDFDVNLLDPLLSEVNELGAALSLHSPEVAAELHPLLDRIKNCKDLYQLHAIRAELFPDENAGLSEIINFSRSFSEAEMNTVEQKCALERGFYKIHAWVEKNMPYSFRAGQNINVRCLLHALFQKSNSDYHPLLEAFGTLTKEQVKKIAYSLTGLFIYLLTLIYQLPKFTDEIKRSCETGKVSGTLILKGAVFSSSLLYVTATLLLLGGAGSAATVVRMVAGGINLLDVPVALITLAESWIDFYKYGTNHLTPARQFMVKESNHKTTARITTEALALVGSLAGKICYESNIGSARMMLGIFGLNCANLPFHQNPFEAVAIGPPLLKKKGMCLLLKLIICNALPCVLILMQSLD